MVITFSRKAIDKFYVIIICERMFQGIVCKLIWAKNKSWVVWKYSVLLNFRLSTSTYKMKKKTKELLIFSK